MLHCTHSGVTTGSGSDLDSDSDLSWRTRPPDSGFMRDPPAPLSPITVEEFVHAQFLDPFCQKVRAEIDRGLPTAFQDDSTSGVLIHHVYATSQVAVPAVLQKRLLTLEHHPQCSGAPGRAQTVRHPATGLLLASHGAGLVPHRYGTASVVPVSG